MAPRFRSQHGLYGTLRSSHDFAHGEFVSDAYLVVGDYPEHYWACAATDVTSSSICTSLSGLRYSGSENVRCKATHNTRTSANGINPRQDDTFDILQHTEGDITIAKLQRARPGYSTSRNKSSRPSQR
jgi:hypothetical protein